MNPRPRYDRGPLGFIGRLPAHRHLAVAANTFVRHRSDIGPQVSLVVEECQVFRSETDFVEPKLGW